MTARQVRLTEFAQESAVALSPEERDGIRRLHPGLRMEPSSGREGHYDLTPDEHVGLISLPSVVVQIQPKIPMSSVFFLISYACDSIAWLEGRPELARSADLTDVLALLLARSVQHATRRGLFNGYVTHEEALPAPRGRLLFSEQIRKRMRVSSPVEVRHDVFTADVLENRLLLAAVAAMLRLPLNSAAARHELRRAERLFGDVSRLHFQAAAVPDVVITRLNRHYAAPLALSGLILRSMAVDLATSQAVHGAAFLVNMNAVFERFVRIALRAALGVRANEFPDRPSPMHLDQRDVVSFVPDLVLLRNGRVIWVGDAKYKRLAVRGYQNADLYQMLAYSVTMNLPGGMLIYAADRGLSSVDHVVRRSGKRLQVRTLDLSMPPNAILAQVQALADHVKASVSAVAA